VLAAQPRPLERLSPLRRRERAPRVAGLAASAGRGGEDDGHKGDRGDRQQDPGMVEDHGDRGCDQRQNALDAHDCSEAWSGAGVNRGARSPSPPTAGLSVLGSTVTTTGTGTYTTRSSTSSCQGLVQASTAVMAPSTATTATVMAAREVNNHQAVPKPVPSSRSARRRPFTPGASSRWYLTGPA